MQNWVDLFRGDDSAFSLTSMVAAINEVEHIPSRAGELAFVGNAEGVNTATITIERKGEAIDLVKTSPRGSTGDRKTVDDKANLRAAVIPHLQVGDVINADQVVGVREFGTVDQLRTVTTVVNNRLTRMAQRLDLTLENHRLGALKGEILDSDGTPLTNLFDLFGVKNSAGVVGPEVFDLDLDGLASDPTDLRVKCQDITRFLTRNAKIPLPNGWKPWVFLGDELFDKLISLDDVKKVYKNTADQERRLGDNYAFGVFEFGGVVWENYRGTDDASKSSKGTVGVEPDEGVGFLQGVPGLYREYYAPADYLETVNTIGLPRYAKAAPDEKWNKFVELEAQTNPLPLCLRPRTLFKII